MNNLNQTLYTVAAFISAGMHADIPKLDEARDSLGTGCLELVMSAMGYTDYTATLAEVGYAVTGGFPGVFEYECAEEFGKWYVAAALDTSTLPGVDNACDNLRTLAYGFFSRCEGADLSALRRALCAVDRPAQPVL